MAAIVTHEKPEFYIVHGTQKVWALYVIFHETVYHFRILSKQVVVSEMPPDDYWGKPTFVRARSTAVNELSELFVKNLAFLADPLAWSREGGGKTLCMARDPRPKKTDFNKED